MYSKLNVIMIVAIFAIFCYIELFKSTIEKNIEIIVNNKPLLTAIIISIIIASVSFYKYKKTEFDELVSVKSTIDGREYFVQNLPDKQDACDNLAKLRAILIKIVDYMKNKFPSNESVIRLYKNFNPDKIIENPSNSKYTSYSVNKGEKIVFCIRQRNGTNDLVDMNTLTFVAIHELAHLMSESLSIGEHNEEFWENMKFLLKEVIHSPLNVYNYMDFAKKPKEYCGILITDSPYNVE